jgi:hypothetical protein
MDAGPPNEWTWVNGATAINAPPVYGTQGQAAAANTPGGRYAGGFWADTSGHLWLFGGSPDSGNSVRNDLWKFDGANWTWMTGANTTNAGGTYGTLGQPAAGNTPGARYFPAYWKDLSNNLWLFGGKGHDASATLGMLSDVWKWNGTQWTWVSGSNTSNASAVFGTKGTASGTNTPGGRARSATWSNGTTAWIFGGVDSTGNFLADLWKFDGANWTWISGPSTANTSGVYGTKGTAAASNAPGGRQNPVSWIDSSGHLWLFGGFGRDGTGATTSTELNDLWKWDGTNWTWVAGSSTGGVAANRGTQGVAATTNDPGGRDSSVSWVDASGTMWMMGGSSDSQGAEPELNDLWKFDGTNWTWVSGSNTNDPVGTYGSIGVPGASNTPGGRDSANACTDSNGNLWLQGGFGWGATNSAAGKGNLGDLWRYRP